MSYVQQAKRLVYKATDVLHVSSVVLSSEWRRSRLLILCYHGVSLGDEHEWSPGLYLTRDLFRARLQRIKERDCTVLPLGEAVERLYAGTLPKRSVALTFDDGFYDFYSLAWPILKEFSWPVTVYLATYYSSFQRPVFDPMCSYLLWKARNSELVWPEVFAGPVKLDSPGLASADAEVKSYCLRNKLSGRDKDGILIELARRLNVDLEDLCRRRILHVMDPREVAEVAAQGADIQLHTHRHRVSHSRERFWREIDENRERIRACTGKNAVHFCYPGGFWLKDFPEWLRERRVVSATTCDIGMASREHDPFYLPRVLDGMNVPAEVFDSWVSGMAEMLSRHSVYKSEGQLMD